MCEDTVLNQGGWGGDRERRRLQESLVEIVEAEVDYDLWVHTAPAHPRRLGLEYQHGLQGPHQQ